MKFIDCTTLYLPVLASHLNVYPTRYAQCITCVEDGKAIAGVIYDDFNTVSITAHIWISEDKKPCRDWFAAIFDYPFNRLGVKQIVGQVTGENATAQKLDGHFGFTEVARIKDYSPAGDLIFYSMKREDCRVLNSELWSGVVSKVRAA
jgi:RimJ/RimL family protein N-acetyltransferase